MNSTVSSSCHTLKTHRLAQVGAAVLLGMSCQAIVAENHAISPEMAKFNCSVAGPGDTITLAGGVRGRLSIENCTGSASAPIVIRNDVNGSGPTVIQNTSGDGFVFQCYNCKNIVIDGTGKWQAAPSGRTYGIKVLQKGGGSPAAFVKLNGRSSFMTIRGVEVDGKWPSLSSNGVGIDVNDHTVDAASNPGVWREGILIEKNYVHAVEGEGMYVGPNFKQGDLPLRNIEIRDNIVENTGWDGINLKMAVDGSNSIHHNILRRTGSSKDGSSGQHYGIALYESTGAIYNNWVEEAGESGITHYMHYLPKSYGVQQSEIYNNVVIRPGATGPLAGNGIVSASSDGATATSPRIYSNTIVGARGAGIRVGTDASGGYVRDNIVVDSKDTAISAPSSIAQASNLVGSASKAMFIDADHLDFRLQAASPARNAGSSSHPEFDYADVKRSTDGAVDIGAFEYGSPNVQPMPPSNLVVE